MILGPLAVLTAVLVVVAATRGSGDVSPRDAAAVALGDDGDAAASEAEGSAATDDTVVGLATSTTVAATTTTTTTVAPFPLAVDDGKTSSERRLVDAFTVEDPDLQPKSIVSSGDGLFFAQNMMYRHNVSIYDRAGNKVATIPDEVDLSAFGIDDRPVVQGSPVEAAFTPDGRYVYVSNYKMFGDGYSATADDDCNRGDWEDSFVYKIDTETFEIVAVTPTGAAGPRLPSCHRPRPSR